MNVDLLNKEKEKCICELLLIFRKLSDHLKAEEFTDEDLKLWGELTQHSAIQNRISIEALKESKKEKK